jgi:hypothetical protein
MMAPHLAGMAWLLGLRGGSWRAGCAIVGIVAPGFSAPGVRVLAPTSVATEVPAWRVSPAHAFRCDPGRPPSESQTAGEKKKPAARFPAHLATAAAFLGRGMAYLQGFYCAGGRARMVPPGSMMARPGAGMAWLLGSRGRSWHAACAIMALWRGLRRPLRCAVARVLYVAAAWP